MGWVHLDPGWLADTQLSSLSRTCSLPESRRRDDTADADADVAHPRRQPSTNSTAMGSPRRRYDHGGAQSSRTDDHRGDHGGDDHRGDRGGDDHKASTLTATTCLTASIEMEANQETHNGGGPGNARWTAYGSEAFAVLSRWRRPVVRRQFSKVGHENGGGPVNARWTA